MPVKLLDTVDVTDRVLNISKNRASIGTVEGILTASRDYTLKDNDGAINFLGAGLLGSNVWRDQKVEESDVDGQTLFKGLINSTSLSRTDLDGYLSKIGGKDLLGTVLKWRVDSLDQTTHAGFLVNNVGGYPKGTTVITIDTGTSDIPIPSQVTFSDSLVPRYNIIESSGSPTTTITLDRGLEVAIEDDAPMLVTIPVFKEPALEILDSLITLNAVSDRGIAQKIGSSFISIINEDRLAGRNLWIHVRREDNVSFKDHLAMILEMSDLGLTISEEGVIDVFRGNEYKGNEIAESLTPKEVLVPYTYVEDSSKLVIGYDCLYRVDEQAVANAQGDVDQSLIDTYKGLERWVPVPLAGQSANIFDYKVLYGNAATADYFGQRRLDYYGHIRVKLKCSIRESKFGNPLNRILPQLGREYALSLPTSDNRLLVNEPSRVTGFEYNESLNIYTSLTLELTNFPSPNLPVEKVSPSFPEITLVSALGRGFKFTAKEYTGNLRVKIYYEDQAFFLLDAPADCPNPLDPCVFYHKRIQPNRTYFARFYTEAFGHESELTDWIQFTTIGLSHMLLQTGDFLLYQTGERIEING